MASRQVPREEWRALLDRLGQQRESGVATLEERSADVQQRAVVRAKVLTGLTLEIKGSGKGQIDIMFGGPTDTDERYTHTIIDPAHIKIEEAPGGGIEMLQIEDADGATTLVYFQSAT